MRDTRHGPLLLVLWLLVGAGCSAGTPAAVEVTPSGAGVSTPALSSGAPTPAPTSSDEPGFEDELGAAATHEIRSDGLVTRITYSSKDVPAPWRADSPKSLGLVVSVRPTTRGVKKVYVTRTSLRLASRDGAVAVPLGDAVVDTANIDPGYLLSAPYAYEQTFSLPPVDTSVQRLAIGVKLELVSLVDAGSKDYTKQTVSDVVTTTLVS